MCLFAWHCRVVLEGFSTFVVNSDGQISLHKMDKVLYCIAVASFPVLPTPAFVSQPWRKSAFSPRLRDKSWGGNEANITVDRFAYY